MTININIQNFGFSTPKYKYFNFSQINNNLSNDKVLLFDDKLVKDIKFTKFIKQIPDYFHFFSPIIKAKRNHFINSKCSTSYSITYLHNSNIKFIDILKSWNYYFSFNNFIIYFIQSYQHLINSIIKLQKYSLSYLNFNFENIFVDNHSFTPYIQNFCFSTQSALITKNKLFFKNLDKENIQLYPFEVFIINYLLSSPSKDINYLFSKDNIQNLVKFYLDNNTFFQRYSNNDYYYLCSELLLSYKEYTYNELINYLCKQHIYWDNYMLSILMLQAIDIIFPNFKYIQAIDNNQCILSLWIDILIKNINPIFTARYNIDDTMLFIKKYLLNNEKSYYNYLLDQVL